MYLDPVGVEEDADRLALQTVVSMNGGIDDGLAQCFQGYSGVSINRAATQHRARLVQSRARPHASSRFSEERLDNATPCKAPAASQCVNAFTLATFLATRNEPPRGVVLRGGPFYAVAMLVPKTGLEPVRGCPQRFLRPQRLPFRHFGAPAIMIGARRTPVNCAARRNRVYLNYMTRSRST
jgi:hypothetical protein